MLIPARNIPSYVQGYRFSDDPRFYDADRKVFLDLAGYGERANLIMNVGTPTFETVGGNRCLKVDNTSHGYAIMPVPWQGTVVIVAKPEYVSGSTITKYPLLFGDAVLPTSNGAIWLGHFSGSRRLMMVSGGSSVAQALDEQSNNNLRVVGFAFDQQTRKSYVTKDGVAVTASAEVTSSPHAGVTVDLGVSMRGMRFGNLTGTAGDTTPQTDLFMYFHELHFFAENIWLKNPVEAAQMMATLRAKYRVS